MELIKSFLGKLVGVKNAFLKLSLIKKILIVVVIIGIGWFLSTRIFANQSNEPQYQTAQAEKGTLITSVSASGTVSSGNSASITSSATGIVSEVYVQNGEMVNAGDPIALVKLDTNSQQQQTQAYASFLSAQNTLVSAKSKMNSLQATLFKVNQEFVNNTGTENPTTDDPQYIIERATWLQAESDYNNQANVIKQAEAALSSASLSYSQLSPTITAPMSGVVSNLSITSGLVISGQNSSSDTSGTNSSSAQSVGTITLEGGTPQVVVNLTEIDVVKVKPGQKATLTLDALPDKTFTGKVSAVNTGGSVSSGVTTYPTTITFDTSVDTIYPNMAVNATIITDVENNVILVPSGAVQTVNGESSVRVLKDGQVASVPVEVGSSNDSQTEIVSGISAGETVVTGQTNTTSGASGASSPFGGTGFGGGSGRSGGFSAPAGGQMIIRR